MTSDAELSALLAAYDRSPSPETRLQLLEEFFALSKSARTVYEVAGTRALLASEQRRADKALKAMVRVESALSRSPTRLAAARARLAAVG